MALSDGQIESAKKTFDKLSPEDQKELLELLQERMEVTKPVGQEDDANKFLLSKITGEDQNQLAEDQAINELVRLAQGR